jgi:hypothetical protein
MKTEEKDELFDEIYSYYDNWATENKIKRAVWSCYDLDEIYPKMDELAFKGTWKIEHYGLYSKHVIDPTWGDLYKLADKLIVKSGNRDHVFIERFTRKGEILEMFVGS